MAGMMNPGLTMDDVYPVGSIYMSVNTTDPGKLFGGSWQRIKERFLLAAGDTHGVGSTGGEFEHALTIDEMPSHSHIQNAQTSGGGINYVVNSSQSNGYYGAYQIYQYTAQNSGAHFITTEAVGDSQAHSITPPYLAVYIWKRIA